MSHETSISFKINTVYEEQYKDFYSKLSGQINGLQLFDRWKRESISYIYDRLCNKNVTSNEILNSLINQELIDSETKRGKRDWHTVLLKGLQNCQDFDLQALQVMQQKLNNRQPLV